MPTRETDSNRRRFIRLAAGGVVFTPLIAVTGLRVVKGAEKPKLDPASDRAKQFQYTHDAASTDNPDRQENARCANCTHFQGDEGTQWAPCNIFPAHWVSADGWCASWFAKA